MRWSYFNFSVVVLWTEQWLYSETGQTNLQRRPLRSKAALIAWLTTDRAVGPKPNRHNYGDNYPPIVVLSESFWGFHWIPKDFSTQHLTTAYWCLIGGSLLLCQLVVLASGVKKRSGIRKSIKCPRQHILTTENIHRAVSPPPMANPTLPPPDRSAGTFLLLVHGLLLL